MIISIKQRRWLLGGAFLLTVAATASVNRQDENDAEVVQADLSKAHVPHQNIERSATTQPSSDVLVGKLKRPLMPDDVKNMFIAKSWYVPPTAPKIIPHPVAPPLPFVYIGKMLEEYNNSTVFLERQHRILVVREGDAIDANYRVDEIKPPMMTLSYLPLNIKQTMQIGEAN
jgi:hypothetical protein